MATAEDRIMTLEARVDRLEVWAGPGQAEALTLSQRDIRADLAKIRVTQDRHTRMIADLTADVSDLKTDTAELKRDVVILKTDMAEVKADVSTLKTDMAEVKADVSTLKTDMAEVKADVSTLKTDMAEVKAGLAEVIRRLPVQPS